MAKVFLDQPNPTWSVAELVQCDHLFTCTKVFDTINWTLLMFLVDHPRVPQEVGHTQDSWKKRRRIGLFWDLMKQVTRLTDYLNT